VSAASIRRPVPFGSQLTIVVHDGIEDRCQHAPVGTAIRAKPVKDELGDRSVTDQVGPSQDLKVS
jgi:hypothetical protein